MFVVRPRDSWRPQPIAPGISCECKGDLSPVIESYRVRRCNGALIDEGGIKTFQLRLALGSVAYFPLYHLRHTFASRLSAGGVSDHFVTLMLRQGDS